MQKTAKRNSPSSEIAGGGRFTEYCCVNQAKPGWKKRCYTKTKEILVAFFALSQVEAASFRKCHFDFKGCFYCIRMKFSDPNFSPQKPATGTLASCGIKIPCSLSVPGLGVTLVCDSGT